MTLTEQINNQLKDAMRAKDEVALRALRAIKAALLLLQSDKGVAGTINPDEEIKLLQKLAKQRKEALDVYRTQGREDLASGRSRGISHN